MLIRIKDKVRSKLTENTVMVIAVLIITMIMAGFYLLGRAAGGNWAWVGLPLDDNWIHLVYARSLAENGGLFYNPGVPEAGISSPLWVFLLAFFYKILTPLGLSPQWCAKFLSLMSTAAVPIAAIYLMKELELNRIWAWLAGLIILLDPNLAYGAVAGMEVGLFTLLSILSILMSLRGRYTLTGFLLGLLVFTRGEGALSALIIGGSALLPLYMQRKEMSFFTKEEIERGSRLFLPALVLGVLWVLYNHSVSGRLLPNTYYVKHNFSLGWISLENLMNTLTGYFGQTAWFSWPILPISLLLLGAAGWAIVRRKWGMRTLPLWLIPFIQTYAFSINIKVITLDEPWTYFTRRYLDAMLPFLIVLMVLGAEFLWSTIIDREDRWVVLGAPLLVALGALVMGGRLFQLHSFFIETYSWNTRNIEEVNVRMGRWLGENLPPRTNIGVTVAGATRFFSRPDQTIIDFLGMNCAECLGRPFEDLLQEFEPDYVVVFRQALDESFSYTELVSFEAERNTILGGSELVAVDFEAPGH